MSGNRAGERARNRAKGSRSYLILPAVRRRPRVEGEKCQRGKCEIKAQENTQVDSTEIVEEMSHSHN